MNAKPPNLCLIAVLISAILTAGCAAKSGARVAAIPVASDSIELLRPDLQLIFDDPNFADAQWGVEVISLDRAEVVYEQNPFRLYMPASNNKIVTAAVALIRLGPEYRYETTVSMDGEVTDGILKGNLVVAGNGDPTMAPRFLDGDPFRVFGEWARRLKDRGIRRIDGGIVGDGSAFPAPLLGRGWEWEDLAYGYAAPVSALQFNENLYTIEVTPGAIDGAQAQVRCMPLPDYVTVDAQVTTVSPGQKSRVEIHRGETGETIVIRGTIARDEKPDRTTMAVRDPALYYVAAFKKALQDEGIEVANVLLRSAYEAPGLLPSSAVLLWSHPSPPLAEILKPLLKVSQNLYAETLARTLGRVVRNEGSFEAGREVIEETLETMAIPRGTYAYADGSGLSRQNLVTADMLVRILRFMHRHEHFSIFYDALPIAGVDGTIRNRMKGTRAENNVHGKTGTIAYVRCLSGYIKTAEGEMLAFAMIANNFLVASQAAEYVQDTALERLASFRRKE